MFFLSLPLFPCKTFLENPLLVNNSNSVKSRYVSETLQQRRAHTYPLRQITPGKFVWRPFTYLLFHLHVHIGWLTNQIQASVLVPLWLRSDFVPLDFAGRSRRPIQILYHFLGVSYLARTFWNHCRISHTLIVRNTYIALIFFAFFVKFLTLLKSWGNVWRTYFFVTSIIAFK